jgi:hypothetical protein
MRMMKEGRGGEEDPLILNITCPLALLLHSFLCRPCFSGAPDCFASSSSNVHLRPPALLCCVQLEWDECPFRWAKTPFRGAKVFGVKRRVYLMFVVNPSSNSSPPPFNASSFCSSFRHPSANWKLCNQNFAQLCIFLLLLFFHLI